MFNRLDLITDLNIARCEGARAAELNEGWEANPFAVAEPCWFAWCSGFKSKLEELVQLEIERKERAQ